MPCSGYSKRSDRIFWWYGWLRNDRTIDDKCKIRWTYSYSRHIRRRFSFAFILVGSSIIEQIPLAALVGVMFMVVIGTFAWNSLKFYAWFQKLTPL